MENQIGEGLVDSPEPPQMESIQNLGIQNPLNFSSQISSQISEISKSGVPSQQILNLASFAVNVIFFFNFLKDF